MVSKVAVIALVAIVACPILLGYAFNLSETTITDYEPDKDSVNVTPLLMNGIAYTDTSAETYTINTNFQFMYDNAGMPLYTTSSVISSLPMHYFYFTNGDYYSASMKFDNYTYFFNKFNSDGNTAGVNFRLLKAQDNSILATYSNICTWDWDKERGTLQLTAYNAARTGISNSWELNIDPVDYYGFQFVPDAGYNSTGYAERLPTSGSSTYVDFSAGYYFPYPIRFIEMNMPDKTSSVLMTLNLDSITDSTYSVHITPNSAVLDLILAKTTVDGVAKWTVTNNYNGDVIADNLYYDPSRSDNTYQMFMSVDKLDSGRWNFHTDFRYVGSWPSLIGAANYYLNYDYDISFSSASDRYITKLRMGDNVQINRTPLIRMDAAIYAGFAYGIIEDQTYAPADFKTNPSTTIVVADPGSALQFGGNNYTIDSKGNITLGTHKVSVYNLVLESIPVAGGYENRINGTAVSTTAQPSTIKFVGSWGTASVSTAENVATTYTKTEWTPGQFGWDGIDQNFLMVGLLTSIGVFIALGLYIRRSRSSLWPLLVVCGGAVVLFFIML